MKKLRIAVIHPFFDVYGGAEKIVFSLLEAVVKKYGSGSCELYTSWFVDALKHYLPSGVVLKTVRDQPLQSVVFGQKFNPALVRDMNQIGKQLSGHYDVILATHWPSSFAVDASLVRFKTATANKTISYCFEVDNGLYHQEIYGKENSHVLEGKSFLGRLKARIAFKCFIPWKNQDKEVMGGFTHVVSISEHNKQDIGFIYSEAVKNKTVVIPTFVDAEFFHPSSRGVAELRKKYGLSSSDKVILSLCRLGQSKRVDFIFRSFKILLGRITTGKEQIKLVIAGTGPDREKLEHLAVVLGISDAVRFVGFIPDQDLVALYNLCTAFIYAGLEANYVLTALEAMACEKPVIGPGSRFNEVFSHPSQGYSCDAHAEQAYADALQAILADPLHAARVGKEARKRVLEGFTQTVFIKRFVDLFEEAG